MGVACYKKGRHLEPKDKDIKSQRLNVTRRLKCDSALHLVPGNCIAKLKINIRLTLQNLIE